MRAHLGREAFKSPLSDDESWQWMLRAAEAGSHEAQYNVGAALATGDWADSGVRQNLETAVAWCRRAADAGHIGAQFNLASMLAEGEGCDRDLAGAKAWLIRAIAGGYQHVDGLVSYLDWMEAVTIVVDPDFGDGLQPLLDRMPVWIADTDANRGGGARPTRRAGQWSGSPAARLVDDVQDLCRRNSVIVVSQRPRHGCRTS